MSTAVSMRDDDYGYLLECAGKNERLDTVMHRIFRQHKEYREDLEKYNRWVKGLGAPGEERRLNGVHGKMSELL